MSKPKFVRPEPEEQRVLEHLTVRPVQLQERERYQALRIEHHYLHDHRLVGEQLGYVAGPDPGAGAGPDLRRRRQGTTPLPRRGTGQPHRHGERPLVGQRPPPDKTNEIPVARTVLEQVAQRVDLAGKLVVLDALHTHPETARQVVQDLGADYLLSVKANQAQHQPKGLECEGDGR